MRSGHAGDAVAGVLDRMEHHDRTLRVAVLGAAAFEGLLMLVAIWKLDWADDGQVLLFIFAVLGYTIVALGLVALGAHVSRVGARVVSALDGQSGPA
jgi:hypothetical protein